MALTLYERCAIESHGDTDTMTKCVADQFDYDHATGERNLTHWLLVILGAFIFFMQAGFAMLCAGCVRKKNVQNTMLKSLLDASGGEYHTKRKSYHAKSSVRLTLLFSCGGFLRLRIRIRLLEAIREQK